MHHFRKTRKRYAAYNAGDRATMGCPLCKMISSDEVLYENNTMFMLPNRVSYDVFEGRRVLDHLMVQPKRHVESINDFTDREKIDHMTILGDYESRGYNVYARSVDSVSRSVAHQHTHLIKLSDKKPATIFFLAKPYLLMHRSKSKK